MRFLTVTDPWLAVHPHGDTTFAILEEVQARGHENLVCGLAALRLEGRRGFARPWPTTARRPTLVDPRHATLGTAIEVAFDDVDVIWMSKDPPIDDLYLYTCVTLTDTVRGAPWC